MIKFDFIIKSMRLKSVICVFLVVILTFSTAFASDVASLRQKAERGDVKAQVELGLMYHEGRDVRKDFKEATKWWKMAADRNDPSAQSHLGTLYALGEGVKEDYEGVDYSGGYDDYSGGGDFIFPE